jgi:hypothetical protein
MNECGNMVEQQATDHKIIRRLRTAYWITNIIDTHPACEILIAFPQQQWLRKRASMHIVCRLPVCV